MITVTLPDGNQRHYSQALSVLDIAKDISHGLAKATLAGEVNGHLVDTTYLVNENSTLRLITAQDNDGVEILRHSCAHLLAHAVKTCFPQAQVTIGPVIDNGFYYDFAYERPFTPEDLTLLEKTMQQLAKKALPVSRRVLSRSDAIAFFEGLGEQYKAEIIRDIPATETLSIYHQGDFADLCRGPHVPNTKFLKAFKLTKLAGAYWRGSANNEMLQRIYGTAWATQEELDAHLERLAEAERRDHRRIAKAQDLFHLQEEAPGMVFWHDKGWKIYQEIEQYIRGLLRAHEYQEVKTPQIVDFSLWEKSGHASKYREEMFATASENREYAIKPMNCPCHVQIFNQGLRSYRELPLRMSEFGCCHRNEMSGALHGLMRVRQFVQDDAHIFCTEAQIQTEVSQLIALIRKVYRDFGFEDLLFELSTRPEQRVGSDELWDKAEAALKQALEHHKIDFEINAGDGAFYGPKIDFALRDSLGRIWQCATIQLDYAMPTRLEASYIAEDGSRQTPVMIHRAILGSIERFIGILLEEYAGVLPVWLAPTQAMIINITDDQAEYAQSLRAPLQKAGIRTQIDLRNEKIGFKIREHTLQRVPYLLIVGKKEQETETVSIRLLNGENLGSISLASALEHIQHSIQQKHAISLSSSNG